MLADYGTTSLSIDVHPLSCSARTCRRGRARRATELNEAPHRSEVAFAGMAVARQRPATANGVVFMLLEDELGQVNLIVPPPSLRAAPRARPRRAAAARPRAASSASRTTCNILVESLESLGPLAREIAGQPRCGAALPRRTTSGIAEPD